MTDKKVEKVYVGKRYSPLDCKVWVRIVETDQVDDYVSLKTDEFIGEYEIEPRLDLRNHAPAGLEWGYEGSGPAQTAIAIASDHWNDDEQASALYGIINLKIIQFLSTEEYLFTDGGHEHWRLPGKLIDGLIGLK